MRGHACMGIAHLSWCLLIGSFRSTRRVGGQHRTIAMKPMIRASLDVTNKLSCHVDLKQKGWLGGKKLQKSSEVTWRANILCQHISQWGQTLIHTSMLYISPRDSTPHHPLTFLPRPSAKCCQTHICAENEWYPRALWVKDSLVKNAVLLDEQINVPCNVVALAFYATLKESINLHNSGEHVLPL